MNRNNWLEASNDHIVSKEEQRIAPRFLDEQSGQEFQESPKLVSKTERRNSIASLVNALALLPSASAAVIRHPFKLGSPRRADEMEKCDYDDDRRQHEDDSTTLAGDDPIDGSLPIDDMMEDRVSGKLIRRQRSKQLSKGRRANRKLRSANFETRMNTSDSSWDKLLKLAEGPSTDIEEPVDEN